MAKATARVRRPSRNNLGNRRLPPRHKRKYTLAIIDPNGRIVRTAGKNFSLTEAETWCDSYRRTATSDGSPVVRPAGRGVRVYAIGIVGAKRVREIVDEDSSLAEAEEFCRIYNALPGNGVAVILLPGAVRRFRGSGVKTRSAWRARQLRRKGWKPSGANGKEPS